ncbi:response regulator [Candidatus Saccharibacteria bacterium]|nr:response regulator [Candidatus Saccharibacteria bacterium]
MSKVLLVEDDNNLREIYEARLQAEGYEIASAQDGEQALVVAKQFKPDLIISDVMMPKISGFEMLDILRNTDGLKQTRVIMLTALGQAEDKSRADSLGADRYLVKSQVTLEDIVKAAHEILDDPGSAAPTSSAPPDPTPTDPPTSPTTDAPTTDTSQVAAPAPEPATPPAPTEPVAVAPAPEPSVQPTSTPDLTPVAAPAPEPSSTPDPSSDPIAQDALMNPAESASDLPVVAAPEATASPEQPSDTQDGAAATEQTPSNDDLLASATDELAGESEPATPNAITPEPAQTPASSSQEEPTETPSQTEAENDGVTIAHKKVIQPLSSMESKPDINELLAREEAQAAAAPATAPTNDTTPAETTPLPPAPAIVEAPAATTPLPMPTPAAAPEPSQQTAPEQPQPVAAGQPVAPGAVDPDSIAL